VTIALVTGAAGFIGSHLCERLLADGQEVRGVDAFTDYYARPLKESNIAQLRDHERFSFVEADLGETPLAPLLEDAEVIFHLAAQPGVRASWGSDFATYVRQNVLVTQRLLEACREQPPAKLVFASSSSIYGDAESYPTSEELRPRPVSPYGVSKLAAEHLCEVYRTNFGLPAAALRLFTVYGPRQRPDMAFSRLVRCAIHGGSFELYGDGKQTRDCTYVGDVVAAMCDAAASEWVGVANIGGGQQTSMREVIDLLEVICGPMEIERRPAVVGDVRHTGADTSVAAEGFGYRPGTSLEEGLRAMVEWERALEVAPQ
jgi:nucleoside-diphosphate-sugar epimerase